MIYLSLFLAALLFLLLFFSLTQKNYLNSLKSQILEHLFENLPFGLLVFGQKFDLLLVNSFLKQLAQSKNIENLSEFLALDKIEAAIIAKKNQINLLIGQDYFKVLIQTEKVINETCYFVFLIPLVTNEITFAIQPAINQIQALRTMALGLAHELKNPITSIKMLLQMSNLKEKTNSDEQFKHILTFELERLDKIISDFVHFADLGELKLEQANLNELISEAEQIVYENYSKARFSIVKTLFPLPKILVDKKKVIQAIMNLLINSIEALNEVGGRIEIKTRRHENIVELEISDDGVGIREEDQEKIFFPFFTTKKNGVGLGLAITQKIILEHKGEITFQSKTGTRTVFKITLPILDKKN